MAFEHTILEFQKDNLLRGIGECDKLSHLFRLPDCALYFGRQDEKPEEGNVLLQDPILFGRSK